MRDSKVKILSVVTASLFSDRVYIRSKPRARGFCFNQQKTRPDRRRRRRPEPKAGFFYGLSRIHLSLFVDENESLNKRLCF